MEGVYGGGGFFQMGRHDQIFESYSRKRETKKNLQIYSYSEFHVFWVLIYNAYICIIKNQSKTWRTLGFFQTERNLFIW